MGKNDMKNPLQLYNSLDQLFRDGCSFNQTELEDEMEWAEEKAKENPRPSSDGFRDMQARMKERGIKPRLMSDFSKEEQGTFRHGNFWAIRDILEQEAEFAAWKNLIADNREKNENEEDRKAEDKRNLPFFQTAGTAAACFAVAGVVFLMKPELDVTGRQEFKFHSEVRDEGKGDVVWNNQEDYFTELSHLEKAYQGIKDKLGINVLKLNYIPEDIVLSKVTIEERHARLEFIQQDNFLYVLEVMYPVEDSANRFSDRVNYKKLYNEWMGKWIFIQRNQLENDVFEYNAYFEHENAYYYLQGIIEEDKFIQILEDLTLEIN